MGTVSQVDVDNIRILSHKELIYVLSELYSIWSEYRYHVEDRDNAQYVIDRIEHEIKEEVDARFSSTGILATIAGLLILAGMLADSLGFIGTCVSLLAAFFIFKNTASKIKTKAEYEAFLKQARDRRIGEIHTAKEELKRLEYQRRIFFNTTMTVVNYFREREGKNLSFFDLERLRDIVVEGKANSFSEARQVLAQEQHNEEMQRLERLRADQEYEHQKEIERIANEHLNEQKRNNYEQQRTAENIARDARRAADAEEERTRIAKDMYRDYRGY